MHVWLYVVFAEAVQRNDAEKMYSHMASIYERTGKVAQADGIHRVVCKKFNSNPVSWIRYGQFKFRQAKSGEARQVLQKSLLSLPKREHISVITKFAIMEFKEGDVERGRTMFENILSNYPKRVDLWSVYLDQVSFPVVVMHPNAGQRRFFVSNSVSLPRLLDAAGDARRR